MSYKYIRDPLERSREYISDVTGGEADDDLVVASFDLLGPTARANHLAQLRDYPKNTDIEFEDMEAELRRESLLKRLEARNQMLSKYGR